MSKHLRLKGYVSGDETISLEGLFGFGGPSDPKLKQILDNHNRTIGNKAWVNARLAAKAISNDRIIDAVSCNGKTYTDPVQALKQSGSMYANFLKRYRKLLDGYGEDIVDIFMWGGQLLQQGQDPNLIGQRMVDELGKHPLPIDSAGRYTEFFGNVAWNPGSGFSTDAGVVSSADKLPPLTANQIVEATKVINDQTTWISKFQDNQVMPGVKLSDSPIYAMLGKSSSRSEIANLFDPDRAPRKQFDQLQKGINHWLNMHKVVLQWINTQLKDSVSTESIDGEHFMSQHNRLSSYLTGEQTTISTEGLWDDIKKLFDAKAPDPRVKEKDGRKVYEFSWVPTFKQEIEKTYANLDWVKRHYHPREVRAPKLAVELSYKRRLPETPLEVLTIAQDVALGHYKQANPALDAYDKSITQLEKEMGALFDKTEDEEKTIKEFAKRAKSLKRPFHKGMVGPEWLGGLKVSVVESRGLGYESVGVVPTKGYHVNGNALPKLTPEQIVEAAKAMLVAVETIAKLKYPSAGSGCDDGVWEYLYGVDDEDSFEIAQEYTYFQAAPEEQSYYVSLYLGEWSDVLYKVARWLHTQVTEEDVSLESLDRSPMSLLARPKMPNKHSISLESTGPRLAKYFDDKPKAARSDQRAALFGTVESGWRAILEDKLECAVFNPVVANWDKEAQAQEELVKKTASALVFCITPKQTGFYSFVELTGAAIRTPDRVYICFLNDDEGTTWPEKQQASIDATKTYLTNECGITVYETLDALAEAINAEVEPISANGSLKDTDNVPTPTAPEGGL